MGQIGIWFSAVLTALLGTGIVGAIAAGPDPEVIVAAPSLASTTTVASSTVGSTTTTTTTTMVVVAASTSTITQTTLEAVVPGTDAVALLTAEVVDGDTITMSDGSTVRLIGIDSPESGQCGSDEATAVLAQLIDGQSVTLISGARDDVDKYGRLLRYVEVNGVDVDLEMIESGRAIARYDGRDGYGVHPRQEVYVNADDLTPSTNICTAIVPATVAPVSVVPIAVVPIAVVPTTTAPVESAPYYKNCTAVRAAGAAPIRAGDPGWQTKFDADGDGVGCE